MILRIRIPSDAVPEPMVWKKDTYSEDRFLEVQIDTFAWHSGLRVQRRDGAVLPGTGKGQMLDVVVSCVEPEDDEV